MVLLMANIPRSPVEVGSLSHYLQGFIHLKWCRISSIKCNTLTTVIYIDHIPVKIHNVLVESLSFLDVLNRNQQIRRVQRITGNISPQKVSWKDDWFFFQRWDVSWILSLRSMVVGFLFSSTASCTLHRTAPKRAEIKAQNAPQPCSSRGTSECGSVGWRVITRKQDSPWEGIPLSVGAMQKMYAKMISFWFPQKKTMKDWKNKNGQRKYPLNRIHILKQKRCHGKKTVCEFLLLHIFNTMFDPVQ